jgi:protein tyrosine/serine phosphatase
MYIYRRQTRNVLLTLAALLFVSSASAETNGSFAANIRIKNFGRTNPNYYRGAQPDSRDYPALAALGVKTVIDLTRDGRADERVLVQRAGMKFYRIPLTTSDRPSDASVAQFLKLVNDPANWPVFVHCQGGRHRTGAMTAAYRITQDGWTADRAYQEMKQYGFETFIGHPELKRFVYAYYAAFAQARQTRAPQGEKTEAAGISK